MTESTVGEGGTPPTPPGLRRYFQGTPAARRQTGFVLVALLLVGGLAWLLAGYITEGVRFLQDRHTMTLTQPQRDVLDHLAGRIAPGEVVIARDDFITYFAPAFVPAKTLYGNAGYAPDARDAVATIFQTRLVSPTTLDLLRQWQVDALIVERDTPLAFQLAALPNLFAPLYQNEQYALYRVQPNPPTEAVVQGNDAWMQGKFGQAEAAYRQALSLDPANGAALYGLALAAQAQNQPEAAQAGLAQLLALQPDHLPARLLLAQYYRQAGEFDAAREQLETAIASWPHHLPAVETLGDLHLIQGQPAQAIALYARAAPRPPAVRPGQYHLTLAELYRRKGLPAQAQAEYQAVIDLETLPEAGLRSGFILGIRQPLFNLGLQRLGQAYTELAELQQQAGDSAAAEAAYRQAITLLFNNQLAAAGLADLYRAANRPEEAITLYRLTSRRNPNAAWPHLALGQVYLEAMEQETRP